jgi:7,8-dihydroneopterin aldolase/epimerase/oxygenase
VENRGFAARLVSSRHEPDSVHFDRLLIGDLVLPANIGVHPHEKTGTQRVRINVELEVDNGQREIDDEILNVVSYEHIVRDIKALIAVGHINLVETLAERIAGICLDNPRARRVRVRVEKLDIEPDAAAVGVEIERPR